ncbi:hypothetical protein OROHE_008285 [Orobanche hederae]
MASLSFTADLLSAALHHLPPRSRRLPFSHPERILSATRTDLRRQICGRWWRTCFNSTAPLSIVAGTPATSANLASAHRGRTLAPPSPFVAPPTPTQTTPVNPVNGHFALHCCTTPAPTKGKPCRSHRSI